MKIHKARDDYLSPSTWQFIFNEHLITLACMTDHSYHTCPIFFFGGGGGVFVLDLESEGLYWKHILYQFYKVVYE